MARISFEKPWRLAKRIRGNQLCVMRKWRRLAKAAAIVGKGYSVKQ